MTDGNEASPTVRLRADTPAGHKGPRLDGLDALRAGTMLMVVAFHAALAYAPTPIPRLIWACRDSNSHPIMDLFCWWSLGISAPFFLMSGFFADELHARRGGRAFLIGRARRVGVPLLVGCLTVLPATFCVWVAGWLASGECTLREVGRIRFHAKGFQENLCGPAHLWSLEYLTLMLLIFWCWKAIVRRLPASETSDVHRWERRPAPAWFPLWPTIPTALILWAGHHHGGLDVIMDRSNSFLPEPYRVLHYGLFFVVGVGLSRSRQRLEGYAARGWIYLALSVPAFAARAWLIREDLVAPLTGPSAVVLAVTGALFSWLLTFGLLGVSLGPAVARPRSAVRYLADSSYWIYLCHLPIVGLAQIAFLQVPAPAVVKFTVVLATTVGLGLATYQAIIRHTIIGIWLHGDRDRKSVATLARPAAVKVMAGRPSRPASAWETSR